MKTFLLKYLFKKKMKNISAQIFYPPPAQFSLLLHLIINFLNFTANTTKYQFYKKQNITCNKSSIFLTSLLIQQNLSFAVSCVEDQYCKNIKIFTITEEVSKKMCDGFRAISNGSIRLHFLH